MSGYVCELKGDHEGEAYYLYTCRCTYTYIHTYIQTDIHTYMHTYNSPTFSVVFSPTFDLVPVGKTLRNGSPDQSPTAIPVGLRLIHASIPYKEVSQNDGYLIQGPHNKDCSILGSILGSPYFGKLPQSTRELSLVGHLSMNIWLCHMAFIDDKIRITRLDPET